MHDRFPEGLPDDLAVYLKNIANIELHDAQKYEKEIRRWYSDDISWVSHDVTETEDQKSYMRSENNEVVERPMAMFDHMAPDFQDVGVRVWKNNNKATKK